MVRYVTESPWLCESFKQWSHTLLLNTLFRGSIERVSHSFIQWSSLGGPWSKKRIGDRDFRQDLSLIV